MHKIGFPPVITSEIMIVEDGDSIIIDIQNRKIDLEVTTDEVKKRQANWKRPEASYTRGVLAKYAKTVSSASCAVSSNADGKICIRKIY